MIPISRPHLVSHCTRHYQASRKFIDMAKGASDALERAYVNENNELFRQAKYEYEMAQAWMTAMQALLDADYKFMTETAVLHSEQ